MRTVPKQITGLVKHRQVLFSAKARHQLDIGDFDTDDLMHSILCGQVVKKERDERKESQYKYIIIGPFHSWLPYLHNTGLCSSFSNLEP